MSVKTTARSRHQPFMASPSQRTIDGCITLRSSSSTYQWGVLPSNVQSLHSSAQSCNFLIIKVDSFIIHSSFLLNRHELQGISRITSTIMNGNRTVERGQVGSIFALDGRASLIHNPHQQSEGRKDDTASS